MYICVLKLSSVQLTLCLSPVRTELDKKKKKRNNPPSPSLSFPPKIIYRRSWNCEKTITLGFKSALKFIWNTDFCLWYLFGNDLELCVVTFTVLVFICLIISDCLLVMTAASLAWSLLQKRFLISRLLPGQQNAASLICGCVCISYHGLKRMQHCVIRINWTCL